MKQFNLKTIAIALEATYGNTPGAYTAIEFERGAKGDPESDEITRDPLRSHFSPVGTSVIGKRYSLSGQLNLKPGGVTGSTPNPPECDLLLQACGYKRFTGILVNITGLTGTFQAEETVNNTTAINDIEGTLYAIGTNQLLIYSPTNTPADGDALSGLISGATATVSGAPIETIVYKPVSKNADVASLAVRENTDGYLIQAKGLRGDVNFTFKSKDLIKLDFTMQGIYVEPSDDALVDAVYSTIEPAKCNPAVITLENLDTAGVVFTTFTYNSGNEVTPDDNMQADDAVSNITIDGRAPTFSTDPNVEAIGDWNPYALASASTKFPISITVTGSGLAGERVRMDLAQAQIKLPKTQEVNKKLHYQLEGTPTGNSDNEMFLTFY